MWMYFKRGRCFWQKYVMNTFLFVLIVTYDLVVLLVKEEVEDMKV